MGGEDFQSPEVNFYLFGEISDGDDLDKCFYFRNPGQPVDEVRGYNYSWRNSLNKPHYEGIIFKERRSA